MSKMQANCRFHIKIQKLHSNCTQSQKENAEKPAFARLFGIVMFIPTRCKPSGFPDILCTQRYLNHNISSHFTHFPIPNPKIGQELVMIMRTYRELIFLRHREYPLRTGYPVPLLPQPWSCLKNGPEYPPAE